MSHLDTVPFDIHCNAGAKVILIGKAEESLSETTFTRDCANPLQ